MKAYRRTKGGKRKKNALNARRYRRRPSMACDSACESLTDTPPTVCNGPEPADSPPAENAPAPLPADVSAPLCPDAQRAQREGRPDGPAAFPLDGEAQGVVRQAPYDVNDPWGFSFKLVEYGDVVRTVAREQGVPLVDVFKAFHEYDQVDGQSVDDLLLDGMHPNDKGHALIAELLAPLMEDACK
ncbi:MAG: GDSL-type esterase/lipase family protein [Pirellulaceae bacterium]